MNKHIDVETTVYALIGLGALVTLVRAIGIILDRLGLVLTP